MRSISFNQIQSKNPFTNMYLGSFLSPAKLASITNQLNIGGRDLMIMNIIYNDKTALKLFVLICLFKRSKFFIPLYSIRMK